jgi:thioredoxin 1
MSNSSKLIVVIALAVAIAIVVVARSRSTSDQRERGPSGAAAARPASATQPAAAAIPRLVDLGAGKCIPCRQMAPILEELRTSMAGKLQVDFIDVWENPGAGQLYGISIIPTQIFYDAAGQELSRHEGFMAREDILARFKEHGIELPAN